MSGIESEPVPARTDESLAAIAAEVDAFFAGIFELLAHWQPQLRERLTDRIARGDLTGAWLEELIEPDAHAAIDDPSLPVYGAGFIAANGVVSDGGDPLAWWQGPKKAHLAGRGEADFIEYRRMEWYRIPELTGRRHVAGPYVDYLCTSEINITVAHPMVIGERFVGVSCIDVLAESLEQVLLPHLEAAARSVSVVNPDGRIVVSSDPSRATGDLIDLGQAAEIAECAEPPYRVVRHR